MKSRFAALGYDATRITPHSLRAGSATEAAHKHLPDSFIKQLGRWQSDAYICYIRPSTAEMAGAAAKPVPGPHQPTNTH